MSESPTKRFRRIVTAWREQKQGKQKPAALYLPMAKHGQDPPAPTQPDRSAQPSGLPSKITSDTDAEPPSPPDARLPRQVQEAPPLLGSLEHYTLESIPDLDKLKTPAEARHFLERLRDKTNQVVQDYANGLINQRQLQAVYSHYQRQRIAVQKALIELPGSGAWRAEAVEGHTSFLRQQHAAQVVGYAIYNASTCIQVNHVGRFDVDDAVLAPLLASLHSDATEPSTLSTETKQIEIDAGRWLCLVQGRYTDLVLIYSTVPAAIQIQMIEDLHYDFEMVNEAGLSTGDVSEMALTFTHLWAFGQGSIEP